MLRLSHRGKIEQGKSENTLEALQNAILSGSDGIECDIRLNADGVPVLFHDASLRRLCGVRQKLHQTHTKDFLHAELKDGGQTILFADLPRLVPAPSWLYLELKEVPAFASVCAKLKTSTSLRQRSIIASFKPQVLVLSKQFLPELPRVLNVPLFPIRKAAFLATCARIQPWGVAFPISQLSKSRVSWLREHGLMVCGWDVNRSEKEANKASKLQLDVSITHELPPNS